MILLANFLTNLLCAAYSCQFHYSHPTSAPAAVANRLLREINVDPIVFTKSGAVEGYFMTVVTGRDIYAFEGIFYSERPELFQPPVRKKPWDGILQAKKPGPACLQLSLARGLQVIGNEDCLHLNVFTPQIPPLSGYYQGTSQKLPVIIYIHGGNFYYGTSKEHGPAYLLQEDVILVTINYRLGVLGFLSTGDEQSPGNWGLKDQALAIKWVHENIDAFGGDKDKITIFGQSAGAVSVHLQMLSTTSIARGLFSKAIALSGSAFCHWGLQSPEYARQFTNKISKIVGCPTTSKDSDSRSIINCLRRVNRNFLVGAQRQLFKFGIFPLMLFAPVIEPNISRAFITDTAANYYKDNLVMKIPFICTTTASESSFLFLGFDNLMLTNYYLRFWRTYLSTLYDYERYVENSEIATDAITKAYFGAGNVKDNGLLMDRKIFEELGSDRYFVVPSRLALQYHCIIAPTYSYTYHFRSESGMATSIFHDYRKSEATHSEDLASYFNISVAYKPLQRGTLHFEVSKALVNIITNFANKGEPLYTNEDGRVEKIWEPITNSSNLKFLKIGIDGSFRMVPDSFEKANKLNVWKVLGIFK